MNQAGFAKLHGVSRKTITAWKTRGWLVLEGEEIVVEASNALIARYRKKATKKVPPSAKKSQEPGRSKKARTRKQGIASEDTPAQIAERIITRTGATMSRDEALTMKENYFALLAQLEYEVKAGQLLPWQEMVDEVSQEYARIRTRLVALPPEHGPRLRALATTTGDTGFVTALQELINEALYELAIDSKDGLTKTV